MDFQEIQSISDLVSLLKLKQSRDNGVSQAFLAKNGMVSIHAVATGLRVRGYDVEVFGEHPHQCLRLLAVPSVGARRRLKDQLKLGDE